MTEEKNQDVNAAETIPSEAKAPEVVQGKYPPCEKLTGEKLKRLEELDHFILVLKSSLYDYFESLGNTQKDINNTTQALNGITKDRQSLISEIYNPLQV